MYFFGQCKVLLQLLLANQKGNIQPYLNKAKTQDQTDGLLHLGQFIIDYTNLYCIAHSYYQQQ